MQTANEEAGLFDVSRTILRAIIAVIAITVVVMLILGFFAKRNPIQAAYDGDYDAVVAYVRKDPKVVNWRDEGGRTLLYAAASGDHPEIVKFLIESGADPNLPNHNDQSPDRPVDAAAYHGSALAMKALVEAGADLNSPDKLRGEPPILAAARNGHLDVVRVLLDAGVDPNAPDWYEKPNSSELREGMRALECAAIRGHVKVVKLLIERGAKVKYIQDGGRQESVLHTFIFQAPLPEMQDERHERWRRNMPTIIDLLVKELGDVNFRVGGDTPLHEAAGSVRTESLPIVRHLVENYPELEVNAKDGSGNTPLHYAMRHHSQVRVIEYLVENCPDLDLNATDEFQHTPLHEGARTGNAAAVKYLLENCPTVNVNVDKPMGIDAAQHDF